MGEQPYVDRHIDLMNNTSRPERVAVYLSINHSSISAREVSPGGGDAQRLRPILTAGPGHTLHNTVHN